MLIAMYVRVLDCMISGAYLAAVSTTHINTNVCYRRLSYKLGVAIFLMVIFLKPFGSKKLVSIVVSLLEIIWHKHGSEYSAYRLNYLYT